MIDLARHVTTLRCWEWMPGMLTRCHVRVFEGGSDYLIGHRSGPTRASGGMVDTIAVDAFVPDLTDAATLGCLLMLVRRMRHDPTYLPTCLDSVDEAWVVNRPSEIRQTRHGSYAGVLVAALCEVSRGD